VLAYQQTKLQLVRPAPHAPLLTTSLVAHTDLVYVFAGPAKFQAQQLSVGVHITHAMSLLSVSKNTVFPKAVGNPEATKQLNAVASPNQYAGRPGVPTAC